MAIENVKSIKFIPYEWREYNLYKELICPMIDWVLDASKEKFDYIAGKYTKYLELDEALARELIAELGYEYILDGITLNSTDIRVIFGYLKLFHLLKATKEGLKLILDLLGYEYIELEWFEKSNGTEFTRAELMGLVPLSEPDIPTDPFTFKLEINLLLQNFDAERLRKFIKFTRQYVYDICKLFLNIIFDCSELFLNFAGFIDQEIVTEGYAGFIYMSFSGFLDQEISDIAGPIIDINFNSISEDQTDYNNDGLLEIADPEIILDINFNSNTSDNGIYNNDGIIE